MDLNQILKNPEQIKGLIQVLQSLLPNDDADQHTENTQAEQASSSQYNNPVIKTRGGGKTKKGKKSINHFDKMSEFNMHKDDAAIDKMLCKNPPVARNRTEMSPISVTCRICGKQEMVSPSLIFDSISRYKCNNCSTQAG